MDAGDPSPENEDTEHRELRGSLPDLPDLAWEDFQRSSELAQRDLGSGEEFYAGVVARRTSAS